MTGKELISCIKKYDLEDEEIIGLDNHSSIFFTSMHTAIVINRLIINGDDGGQLVEYENTSKRQRILPEYI